MPTVTTRFQTYSSSSSLCLAYPCAACGSRIIKRVTLQTSQQGRAGGLFGADPNQLREAAEKGNQEWEMRFLQYLEAPTAAGYAGAVKQTPVLGFDTPCPICGAKEAWQDEARLQGEQSSSPITVSRALGPAFEEARAALRETLRDPAKATEKYTGKAILAEKDTTLALALCREGRPMADGEEISLNAFKKIKAITPSPYDTENAEAIGSIIKSLAPMMEEA